MREAPFVLGAVLLGILVLGGGVAYGSVESEVAEATAAGKAVFLVVTERGAPGTDRAMHVARQAQARAPATAIVLLDRAVEENAEVVKRYRVAGVPVPMTLVVASNGAVAAGVTLDAATPEVLVRAIPSPKKAEVLLASSQGMTVFLVATRPDMPEQGDVFEACTQAVRALEGKATTVVLSLQDEAEKAYREELGIAADARLPTTVVWNAKGQKTAMFRRTMTAEELLQAARQKAACCPGGKCG